MILMLDEIEYITPGLAGMIGTHWDTDSVLLWQTIRAVHQETQGKLTFIVAGVNPSAIEQPHFGTTPNPVFQLAVPQYLEPLSATAIRTMVRAIGRYSGLRFDEPVYTYLQRRWGGHPYLVRIACSEVRRASNTADPTKRARVSLSTLAQLDQQLAGRLAQPIKDILLSLVWWYPDEYALLQILAEGDEGFVSDYLGQVPESFLQFARYGILREEDQGFAIEDVRDFIRAHGEEYKREVSPFRRGDMPPELLPIVPDLETVGSLFTKRSEIEVLLRRAVIMYVGIEVGWDEPKLSRALLKGLRPRADRKDPAQLFIGRRPQDAVNELYAPELMEIVLAHWASFGTLFDSNQSRFQMNMETLNIARRIDAHAKPVSHQELVDFNNSYGWLLARLERIGHSMGAN